MEIKVIQPFNLNGKTYKEGAIATLDNEDAKRIIWLGYAIQNTEGAQCKKQKSSSTAKPLK